MDAGHRGPTSDKRLYEQSTGATQFPKATKQGDLGYLGTADMRVPVRKPRGQELSEEQRAANRALSQARVYRVYVEHGIRRLKGWRIMRGDYRLGTGLFPMIAGAVVGWSK